MQKADNLKHLRKLFPEFTEAELQEADQSLEAYVQVALRIYERIASDPVAYAELKDALSKEKGSKK